MRYVTLLAIFTSFNVYLIAKNTPSLTIVADQMTYDDKDKISTATGNAVATFHSVDGKQELYADSMIAHHNTTNANDFNALHAKRGSNKPVLFQSPTLRIRANTCHYNGKVQSIDCTGCIKVTDLKKGDTVMGDSATVDLNAKTYIVKSDSKSLSEAIIHTK